MTARRPAVRDAWDALAALASALALAGGLFVWLGPTGTRCAGAQGGPPVCQPVSVIAQVRPPALAAALLAATVAAGLVPYLARRRGWALVAFAVVIAAFYVVSFGIDLAAMPAAACAAAAGWGRARGGAGHPCAEGGGRDRPR